jgi:putative spermidine/putrescine transport system permease protein
VGQRLERASILTTTGAGGVADGGPAPRPLRRANRYVRRHRTLGLLSMLTPPVAWMLVLYIGSLVLLVVAALFTLDPVSQKPTNELTTNNVVDAVTNRAALELFAQTVGTSALVTLLCIALALPTAFFVAKVAPRWTRRSLMVSLMLPLWAGYMVKTYAWRTMVAPAGGNRFAAEGRGGGGFMQSVLGWTPGYSWYAVVIALTYLWFPFMLLPIYAGLDRLPASLLDASGDLGARAGRTFRSVIVPLLLPSIAAGSIFTFSLSLGDYILPRLVVDGRRRVMFGELINTTLGAPNQPLAAAYTLFPLVTIVLYLVAMKRAGAFDNL